VGGERENKEIESERGMSGGNEGDDEENK